MPHNLFTDPITGQTAMMYVGITPWHSLGTKLNNPPKSDDAIISAGLDWRVEKYPLVAKTPHGNIEINDRFAVMREDFKDRPQPHFFAIVSKDYEPLQNIEAFQFFDDIVGRKEAIYETAGALGSGERVWILAKLPESIRVVGDDICDKYLLLSNSHDGKSSVQIKFTPIRVVCQNTLTMALSHGTTVRIPHNQNIRKRLSDSERLLGIIKNRFTSIEQDFIDMVSVNMDKKSQEYFKIVFPDPAETADEQALKKVENNRREAEKYFRDGLGNKEKGAAGTLWAAYNGITEMVDHHQLHPSNESHLSSIWFGDGYLIKARAYKAAIENMHTWAW